MMAKAASKSAATKKKAAPKKKPADPHAKIKSAKTLEELFKLKPSDKTGVEWQVWVAKGKQLAKESGVAFGPM